MEDKDRMIQGEPLYWTTTQVGEKVGEADSTIRYWCIEFSDFLEITTTGPAGKKRLFKATDIQKIEYIKKLLKEEGFSIRQVKEFLSTAEGEAMLPIDKAKEQLVVEAVTRIVAQEMDKRLEKRLSDLQEMLIKAFVSQADAVADVRALILQERENAKAELLQETKDIAEKINALSEQGNKEKNRGWFSRVFKASPKQKASEK